MKKIPAFLILATVVLLCGCANKFENNYTGWSKASIQERMDLIPCTDPMVVPLTHYDLVGLMYDLFEDGYTVVGSSTFNARSGSRQEAVNYGKSLGACLIYFGKIYTNTKTGTTTVEVPVSETTTTQEGTIYHKGRVKEDYTITTTTTEKELQYVPYADNYYDYIAVYALKSTKSVVGILPGPLPEDYVKKVGGREGFCIMAVQKGGNGFKAGLMRGDILLSINNTPLYFENEVSAVALKLIKIDANNELKIYRNGKILNINMFVPAS